MYDHRVLIVDDVPANLRLLEARLAAELLDVLTATNSAVDTLTGCWSSECDLVLLDVMMRAWPVLRFAASSRIPPATHPICQW